MKSIFLVFLLLLLAKTKNKYDNQDHTGLYTGYKSLFLAVSLTLVYISCLIFNLISLSTFNNRGTGG